MKKPLEDDQGLDRLFRDKLAAEETTPPAFVWENVRQQLHPPRRRPAAWKWWLSGALLLLLLTAAWFRFGASSSSAQKKNTTSASPLLAENEKQPAAPTSSALSSDSTAPAQSSFSSSEKKEAAANSSGEKSLTAVDEKAQPKNSSSEKSLAHAEEKTQPENSSTGKTAAVQPEQQHHVKESPVEPKHNTAAVSENDAVKSPKQESYAANSKTLHEEPVAAETHKTLQAPAVNPAQDQPAAASNENPQQTQPVAKDLVVPVDEPTHSTTKNNTADAAKGITHTVPEESVSSGNYDLRSSNEPKIRPVLPSDSAAARRDSTLQTKIVKTDSTKKDSALQVLPPAQQQEPPVKDLPLRFIGMHASLDNQKVATSKEEDGPATTTDIDLYSGDSKPLEINSSTTSYGGRAGFFVAKHFAVIVGGNYSIFEVHSPGRYFKFNHNNAYTFTFHSATSSVQLPSSSFSYDDNNGPMGDTFIVHVTSAENYSYVHLQLGGAWYPVRGRYFGAYIAAFSNGALLQHEQLTLTSVRTGKTFGFSGNAMSGMRKFTLGAQFGAGVEFTPVRNLGIWLEPAYLVSGAINPENAFVIRPSAFRFQAGLLFHF